MNTKLIRYLEKALAEAKADFDRIGQEMDFLEKIQRTGSSRDFEETPILRKSLERLPEAAREHVQADQAIQTLERYLAYARYEALPGRRRLFDAEYLDEPGP